MNTDREGNAMSSSNEYAGGQVATGAPTLGLHEIQATVLRQRPAPYFGSHVFLRVDDAQAGRVFLRRLTPYVDSAAGWRNAANACRRICGNIARKRSCTDSDRSFATSFFNNAIMGKSSENGDRPRAGRSCWENRTAPAPRRGNNQISGSDQWRDAQLAKGTMDRETNTEFGLQY
jgi:hypothetical protein